MAHEISMGDDGILRMTFIGDVTKEDAAAYIRDEAPFLEAATEAEPLLVLYSDSSRQGKMSSAARKLLAERAGDPRVKVAIVGTSRYMRVLISFVARVAGQESIHLFGSEEEALAWLREDG